MKVRDWIDELEYYDENMEVVFKLCDDITCGSWTETENGNRYVGIDAKLKETLVSECGGECLVDLVVKE